VARIRPAPETRPASHPFDGGGGGSGGGGEAQPDADGRGSADSMEGGARGGRNKRLTRCACAARLVGDKFGSRAV
jgi:hypothetical protein